LSSLYPKGKSGQVGISLRPGILTDAEGAKVALGKIGARGKIPRYDVARATMELLANDGVGSCWLDLLDGEENVETAVARCAKEAVDCSEG